MATDPAWLATAKTLAAGRRARIECCSTDKSCIVFNEPRGYRAYCFRCGPLGFVAHGDFSIDQLRRRREELALIHDATVRLPKDFTTDIPPSEAVWLLKAGVGVDVAKHYRFGYSAYLRRVILPVYRGDKLLGFTARSTINERPKYIEKLPLEDAVFLSDPDIALPSALPVGTGPAIVFTEDILSAVRVGRVVRYSCALLGTSANAAQIDTALRGVPLSERLAVWLDPDKAGRRANARIVRTLRLMGYEVREVRTPKDPKYYSNREIRSILSD